MQEDHHIAETCRGDEEAIPSSPVQRVTPLSYEEADGILQKVLRACGYQEAHMKKSYAAFDASAVTVCLP